jgi:hypothetical protein
MSAINPAEGKPGGRSLPFSAPLLLDIRPKEQVC